jgi:hypothetical protein
MYMESGVQKNRPCCARNICLGFADVTRSSRVNPAHYIARQAQYSRHVARVHHANVARTCRAMSAQQGMLLLDPFMYILYM